MFQPTTQNVHLLDPALVSANQLGQLTDSQRTWLGQIARGQGAVRFLLPALIVGVFACGLFPMLGSSNMPILFLLFSLLIVALVVAQVGGSLARTLQLASRVRADLAQVAVRQAQGQLAFQQGRYVIPVGEYSLSLPAEGGSNDLLPGTQYRLFYLEKSGLVLSAEEIYPASPAQVRLALNAILAEANKFSVEDLELNHNGEIGPAQRTKALPQALFGAVFGLFGLIFIGIIWLPLFSARQAQDMTAVAIPIIISAIFMLVGGFMFIRALLDMFQGSPAQVEGAGHKETRVSGGKNRQTHYYYVVNGVSFEVGKRAFAALIDGFTYRVYYLSNTKRLLSIEALAGTSA
jgi:hypothetical protein